MWGWLRAHHVELQALSSIATIPVSGVAASVTGVVAYFDFESRAQTNIARDKLKVDAFS